MIRLTVPSIEEEDLAAVREAVASGYLVQGARVAAFESAVADYVGAGFAVAVSNCTAALQLALLSLDVQAGDRVAVTTYSWPATANAIVLCGADPVFVEIDPCTYNMEPTALTETLKTLARTPVKAVLLVHTFGGMADMAAICDVADRYGVPVVEDAACALGASLLGRNAGTWGAIGCFSFHPRKAVTTGEGGVLVTGDPAVARMARILRNHGLDPDAPAPDFVMPGFNFRLTEFQAALGLVQMQKVERIVRARREGAARYDALLAGTPITPPRALAGARHVYQSYVCLLPHEVAPHRAEIIGALRQQGIETTIGTYHMPLTTCYRARGGFAAGDFPVTDDIAARAMSLPLFEALAREQQEQVVSALAERVSDRGPSACRT